MKSFRNLIGATILGLGCIISGQAMALTSVTALFNDPSLPFPQNANSGQDQSGELALRSDGDGGWDPVVGSLEVGDILVGVFFLDSMNIQAIGTTDATNTYREVSGAFVTQVTSISASGDTAACIGCATSPVPLDDFVFAPVSGADLSIWGLLGIDPADLGDGTALAAGAMIVLFEDNTPDMDSSSFGSFAGAVTSATGGDSKWVNVLGFDGTVGDQYWTATAPEDLSDLVGALPTTDVGDYSYQLDLLSARSPKWNWQTLPGTDVEAAGSGNVLTSSSGSAFPVEDDLKVQFIAGVPEPATLLLFGAGLLGLGTMRRK